MQIKVYRFTGLTPLLMANVESINRNLPQMKLGTKPNKGDVDKIAEGMSYRDDDGALFVLTSALRSSLLAGCVGQTFPGSRTGPAKIMQATVFCAEDRAKLLNSKGKPIKDFEIQIDSGVAGSGKKKSRIILVRPRVSDWHMDVPFEIDEEFAPVNFDEYLDILLAIWNRAGRVAGIGAWRPECAGRHGRYSVEMIA